MPFTRPNSGIKRVARSSAPTPSHNAVPIKILRESFTIPPISIALILSFKRSLCRRPILRRNAIENPTPTVMNPSPPTWIKRRITSCPNTFQCVNVSYTTSPVTQVALVAVNMESKKGVHSPLRDAIGSVSIRLPANIIKKKPSAMYCT